MHFDHDLDIGSGGIRIYVGKLGSVDLNKGQTNKYKYTYKLLIY